MRKGKDYTYFDLRQEWETIELKYGFTDDDMFYLFNEPFLDEGVNEGKIFVFSHVPTLEVFKDDAIRKEWNYLKDNYGFEFLKNEGEFWYAK
ncbi:MAG: hypothetical protein J1E62_07175 [Lachnospiraceae bacterium]|nr:hypothetical protein [Lachnospiraceae bacterium]